MNEPKGNFVRNPRSRCELCHDSGFVTARSNADRQFYAFRCLECGEAVKRQVSLKIPEWNRDLYGHFTLWGQDF